MRIHVLRLGMAVVLTVGALALVGVVVAVVDLSDQETIRPGYLQTGRGGCFWAKVASMSILWPVSVRFIITDPGINRHGLNHNGRGPVTGHFGRGGRITRSRPP
jgi:hypothetical protein